MDPLTGPQRRVMERVGERLQNQGFKPTDAELVSYAVIFKLIAATTTEAGLRVQCQLDTNLYSAGRKISDEDMATSPYNRTHSTTNGTLPFRLGPLQLILLLLDGSLGLLDVPPAIYDRLGTQSPKPPENARTMSKKFHH